MERRENPEPDAAVLYRWPSVRDAHFRFTPAISHDGHEYRASWPEVAISGFGPTMEAAVTDLVERMHYYFRGRTEADMEHRAKRTRRLLLMGYVLAICLICMVIIGVIVLH